MSKSIYETLEMAKKQYYIGNYDNTIELSSQIMYLKSYQCSALYLIGKSYLQLEDYIMAEDIFTNLVLFSRSSYPYLYLAYIHLLDGNFENSIQSCMYIIEDDEENWIAHLFLGINYYKTNDIKAAVNMFWSVHTLLQKDIHLVIYFLIKSNLKLCKYDESIKLSKLLNNVVENEESRYLTNNFPKIYTL